LEPAAEGGKAVSTQQRRIDTIGKMLAVSFHERDRSSRQRVLIAAAAGDEHRNRSRMPPL